MAKPYIYVVSSHTGCGCGFLYDGVVLNGPEHAAVRSMYRGFAEYLREHAAGQIVQIYTCWGGDERADPECRDEIDVNEMGSSGFAFQERQFLSVEITS